MVDKTELLNILIQKNFDHDCYSIGEERNESLCLIEDFSGWCVFYSERGHRTEPKYYSTENDACKAFLSRIEKW